MNILAKLKTAQLIIIISIMSIFSSRSADFPTAPAWQLKTQAGKTISLSDYQGKPVILHFWATWCPYCKKLQPKLVALEQKYQESGVKIVSISFNEDEGALPQDEIKARGYDFITALMVSQWLNYMVLEARQQLSLLIAKVKLFISQLALILITQN